jgi:hypothetical protein
MELAIAFIVKSGFIRYTFGDYLCVILIYAIIRGCTNVSVWASSLVVLVIAYTIEFLQLTTYLSLFNLQNSSTANLILGSTFSVSDLIAYTLGILSVLIVETLIKKFEIIENSTLWKF